MLNLFALIAFTVLFFSCDKGKTTAGSSTADYIIVGHTGGFVSNVALTPYFLIKDTTLREDTSVRANTVPTSYGGFNFNYLLPHALYDSVAGGLLTAVPTELLSHNGGDYGSSMPDVGYTDVRAQIGGALYSWRFEYNQTTSSSDVQLFVQKLNKILQ